MILDISERLDGGNANSPAISAIRPAPVVSQIVSRDLADDWTAGGESGEKPGYGRGVRPRITLLETQPGIDVIVVFVIALRGQWGAGSWFPFSKV